MYLVTSTLARLKFTWTRLDLACGVVACFPTCLSSAHGWLAALHPDLRSAFYLQLNDLDQCAASGITWELTCKSLVMFPFVHGTPPEVPFSADNEGGVSPLCTVGQRSSSVNDEALPPSYSGVSSAV
jgi:hypothetical protein